MLGMRIATTTTTTSRTPKENLFWSLCINISLQLFPYQLVVERAIVCSNPILWKILNWICYAVDDDTYVCVLVNEWGWGLRCEQIVFSEPMIVCVSPNCRQCAVFTFGSSPKMDQMVMDEMENVENHCRQIIHLGRSTYFNDSIQKPHNLPKGKIPHFPCKCWPNNRIFDCCRECPKTKLKINKTNSNVMFSFGAIIRIT